MALIKLNNQSLTAVSALPASVTSSGVYLGGTGLANYMDDYEEGTWTPTNDGGWSGGTGSLSYYTKVGQMVFVNWRIALTTVTTNMTIGGLPFTSRNTHSVYSVMTYNSPVTLNYQRVTANSTQIELNVAATWSGNQRYIWGAAWYEAQ